MNYNSVFDGPMHNNNAKVYILLYKTHPWSDQMKLLIKNEALFRTNKLLLFECEILPGGACE